MSETVKNAHLRYREAGDELFDAVRAEFPEGEYVEIPRGHGVVRGWVEPHWRHKLGDPFRIKLRLASTGKTFGLSTFGYFYP